MDANATGKATRLKLDVGREDPGQSWAITRQMSLEVDLSQVSILQPVSGNGAGRKAKGKAEARHSGKKQPSSITALKLIAKQRADEKAQLKDWKAELMAILASKIKQLQDAHGEAVEAQYQEMEKQCKHFVVEIEVLKEELKELKEGKAKSEKQAAEEMERSLVKASVPSKEKEVFFTQSQRSKSPTPTSANPSTGSHLGKRSYASVAVSKPAQVPEQPWTQVKYKSRKPSQQQSAKSALNAEYQGRRILFLREISNQHMSEVDLMLVLNEASQKAGEGIDTRFSQVRYLPSGAVSALLTEKANAGLFIPRLSNVLICAAKIVDAAIVGVEVLEHWQRLKVHGMSLERYLDGGKIELLKREVESSTGIQLKTLPRWLINENQLREQQEAGNKRGSAIVITVKGESKAKQLCASRLRFGGVVRVVERYWEAEPSSVCITCCGIGYERMGSFRNRPPQCIICTGPHQVDKHRCGVTGCNKGRGRICVHVTVKCANCGGNHTADSPRCTSRHKADIKARKEKKTRGKSGKEKVRTENASEGGNDRTEESPEPDAEIDLEDETWAQSPEAEAPGFDDDESRDHT